jgi:hypothetical protein
MSLTLTRFKSARTNLDKVQNNIADVTVPASVGFSDPTQSHVVFDMDISCTDAAGDQILLPCTFGQVGELNAGAHCLVRDVIITSDSQPISTRRERRNYVDANLVYPGRSRAYEDIDATFGNTTNINFGNDRMSKLPDNPFFDYQRPSNATADQDAVPVRRRAEIPVPLQLFDPLATIEQFPNVALGNRTFEFRFDNLLDLVQPCDMPAGQIEPADNRAFPAPDGGANTIGRVGNPIVLTKTVSNFWKPPVAGQQIRVWYKDGVNNATALGRISTVTVNGDDYEITLVAPIAYAANITAFNVNYFTLSGQAFDSAYTCSLAGGTDTDIGSAARPVVIPNVFSLDTPASHRQCPFYPGAPLTVLIYNATLNTITLNESTVTHVLINGTSVNLELATPIALTASGDNLPYVGYRFSSAGVKFSVDWLIANLYIQIAQIRMTAGQMQKAKTSMADLEIPFMMQDVQSYTMTQSQSVVDTTIPLYPGTVGVVVLTPQNNYLVSGRDTVDNYLFVIDNTPYTNTPIPIGDEKSVDRSLHNYLLKRGLSNLGIDFSKYEANRINAAAPDPNNDHTMYSLVVPQSPNVQSLKTMFRSNSTIASKTIYFVLFKPAMLKISGGRAMIA